MHATAHSAIQQLVKGGDSEQDTGDGAGEGPWQASAPM